MRSTVAVVLSLVLVAACGRKTEPADPQVEFSTWAEATEYVREHYDGEGMEPASSLIRRADYYHASGRGYMVIHFKSNPTKGYLYRNVPKQIWRAFRDAPSKGRYYNSTIKGRYRFLLNR